MNSVGQAVGHATTTVSTSNGTALAEHGFFYSGSGPLVDLGSLAGPLGQSVATGIDSGGTVCGYSDSSGPGNPTVAFVWTQGTGIQQLAALGGSQSQAFGINSQGDIIGLFAGTSGTAHGFLYSPGSDCSILGATRPGRSTTPAKSPQQTRTPATES